MCTLGCTGGSLSFGIFRVAQNFPTKKNSTTSPSKFNGDATYTTTFSSYVKHAWLPDKRYADGTFRRLMSSTKSSKNWFTNGGTWFLAFGIQLGWGGGVRVHTSSPRPDPQICSNGERQFFHIHG